MLAPLRIEQSDLLLMSSFGSAPSFRESHHAMQALHMPDLSMSEKNFYWLFL